MVAAGTGPGGVRGLGHRASLPRSGTLSTWRCAASRRWTRWCANSTAVAYPGCWWWNPPGLRSTKRVPPCSAGDDSVDPVHLAESAIETLSRLRPRNVINATGVLLHTNLGRAPLAVAAAEAAAEHATGYGNLEFDLATGDRGGRGGYVETLLRRLTGAPAAMVVNNNAAAALPHPGLAWPSGRSVPVSRGELIEIGGSYRLPELMEASGARLRRGGDHQPHPGDRLPGDR